jgi:hypothetical protein
MNPKITIELTAQQVRDLYGIADRATAACVRRAQELREQGLPKAAEFRSQAADRYLAILDILEDAKAAAAS